MREKIVEQKLVSEVKKRGGVCPKWVSPSFGMVEVKAPGGKPRLLQVTRHKMFDGLGFKVHVLDSVEKIGEVLDEIEFT